jgi:hypothetical protein
VLFACSGIAIGCQGCVTRILTSASLVRALNDKTKHPANLKVCAAIHPLVKIDLVNTILIIVYCFLVFICQYRLKCAMEAMLSQDF